MAPIEQLAAWIRAASNTVFFGGAGVSTESGIPDFRSSTGLYSQSHASLLPPEQLLSRSIFSEQPELFFRYYKENLIAVDAKPNLAHQALARLEGAGGLMAVITQNVDGLHQAAGSQSVIELHGSNQRQYCVSCGEQYSLSYILEPANCATDGVTPLCRSCNSIVRPDVVLYEEALDTDALAKAVQAIASADLLIVGGTSLAVYPAAGLLNYFQGEYLALVNKSETPYDRHAQLVINDFVGKVLDTAVSSALSWP